VYAAFVTSTSSLFIPGCSWRVYVSTAVVPYGSSQGPNTWLSVPTNTPAHDECDHHYGDHSRAPDPRSILNRTNRFTHADVALNKNNRMSAGYAGSIPPETRAAPPLHVACLRQYNQEDQHLRTLTVEFRCGQRFQRILGDDAPSPAVKGVV